MAYDTEQDSIGLDSSPIQMPPSMAIAQPPAVVPPSTPWSTIESASNQISAGQPVTALPKQSWTIPEQNAFNARLDAFDQQAKAARAAAQTAALDAQMFEQMSRVAKSTKDIEIAKRSIDMMGLERDIQNGVPIHEAVKRHPMGLGTSFGNTLKSTAPVTPPTVLKNSGMPDAYVDNRGIPHFVPASSMPKPPLGTTAEPITDPSGNILGYRAPTGPSTGTIISRSAPEGKMTDQQRLRAADLRKKADLINKERETLTWEARVRAGGPENESYINDKNTRLAAIESELAKLEGIAPAAAPAATAPAAKGPNGSILPLPKTKSELRVGDPNGGPFYQTTKGVARWTGTAFEPVTTR